MTGNYVLLDKDRKVINAVALDFTKEFTLPEGVVGFAPYDGPFYVGGTWDGSKVIDPSHVSAE